MKPPISGPISGLIRHIDLTPAAEAMGLERIPDILDDPSCAARANLSWGVIEVDWSAFTTPYHSTYAYTLAALNWDKKRPWTDAMRWMMAHELGHFLQLECFGLDYLKEVYPASVAPHKTAFICALTLEEKLSAERAYRQTPWEADADMTADKYWPLIEIDESWRLASEPWRGSISSIRAEKLLGWA